MNEPCKQGYRCVWGEHMGYKIKCSLPRCPVFELGKDMDGKKATFDLLQWRIAHKG
jgi:hypothetical protein